MSGHHPKTVNLMPFIIPLKIQMVRLTFVCYKEREKEQENKEQENKGRDRHRDKEEKEQTE